VAAAVVSTTVEQGWPAARSPPSLRRRLDDGDDGDTDGRKTCDYVALRLMPAPSVTSFYKCFNNKIQPHSSHDWSVPGAEVHAQVDCWCSHNMTMTMEEYGCCQHQDIYPMCEVDCEADCSSVDAQACVDSCSAMCFEADEYIVDEDQCRECNWLACWRQVKCIIAHAHAQVQAGSLDRTCEEGDFETGRELMDYWQCWHDAPKHSSHWNVISAIVHCICREDMITHTKRTHCCESSLYAGGVCGVECVDEATCATQRAQTCIHDCNLRCPAYEQAPNPDCYAQCLAKDAPCRRFISCRPPHAPGYTCDDGQWPEATSGCCGTDTFNNTGEDEALPHCPRLCETQQIWRLDRPSGSPWWASWPTGPGRRGGMVMQCTCGGCPHAPEGREKLYRTLEGRVWDLGQVMLVDIARREGLRLGPNLRMQELMLQRNQEILTFLESERARGAPEEEQLGRIEEINENYAKQITIAARTYPDDGEGYGRRRRDKTKDEEFRLASLIIIVATIFLCTGCIVLSIFAVARKLMRRPTSTPVEEFAVPTEQVVIGQPVPNNSAGGVDSIAHGTSATTVRAPAATKGKQSP